MKVFVNRTKNRNHAVEESNCGKLMRMCSWTILDEDDVESAEGGEVNCGNCRRFPGRWMRDETQEEWEERTRLDP